MPGLGVEITERFIFHLVELSEQLGDQSVGTAVVGEEIVADAVTSWTPKNLVAVLAQEIAGALHMGPVAQLECRVKMLI